MTDPLENLDQVLAAAAEGKHKTPKRPVGRPKKPRLNKKQLEVQSGLDMLSSISSDMFTSADLTPAPAASSSQPAPPPKKRARTLTSSVSKGKGSKNNELPVEYWQLRAYVLSEHLGVFLQKEGINLDVKSLRRMGVPQMQEILRDIDEILDRELSNHMMDGAVRSSMNVLEELVQSKTSFKPRGTTDHLWSDPKWLALYERFKIGHDIGIRPLNPTIELLMLSMNVAQEKHRDNCGSTRSKVDLNAASLA